jgi:hypothetical protein
MVMPLQCLVVFQLLERAFFNLADALTLRMGATSSNVRGPSRATSKEQWRVGSRRCSQ